MSSSSSALSVYESLFASARRAPEPGDVLGRAIEARQGRFDLRLSEALLRTMSLSPLQLAKTLVSRGSLDEAEALLGTLPADAETLQERARLDFCRGDFARALDWIRAAFETGSDLPGVSRAALVQLRAASAVELREFAIARAALDQLESLVSLYPHGQLPMYGRVLRLRMEAREASPAKVRESARIYFRKLIDRKEFAADAALTYLRLLIDLNRLSHLGFRAEALAALALAERIGDGTYADLARIDLYTTSDLTREKIPAIVAPRARRLLSEVLSGVPGTLSAEAILAAKSPRSTDPVPSLEEIETLVWMELGIACEVPDLVFREFSLQDRSRKLIAYVARSVSGVEREETFRKVWNMASFRPERHDALIRTAVKRLGRQSGVRLLCARGRIRIPQSTLVLETSAGGEDGI